MTTLGRFAMRVAQRLAGAGFTDAANKLSENAWLVEGRVDNGSPGGEHVQIDGQLFSLHSAATLSTLADTVMQIERLRPGRKPRTPKPPKALKTPTGIRVIIQSSTAPTHEHGRMVAEMAVAMEAQIAPYRDNPWFRYTAPYRAWQKTLADRKPLSDSGHHSLFLSPEQLAATLLTEAGAGPAYDAGMERLKAMGHCDVARDLCEFLRSHPSASALNTVELLAAVGACPLPGRTEALRRSLPMLIASLLAAELEQSGPRNVLRTLFGARPLSRDLQILEQVHRTAREELGQRAGDLIGSMLREWDAEPAELRPGASAGAGAWAQLLGAKGPSPLVPDELMRSLMEAALRHARERQVYALPEVEAWVRIPDRLLTALGVERMRFVQQDVSTVRVLCAPTGIAFPLVVPPVQVKGRSLYIAMMAALAYAEMVTRRERLRSERGGASYVLEAASRNREEPAITHRSTQVGRVSQRSGTGRERGAGAVVRAASYVIPHLRLLAVGDASANALAEAGQHGIRVPDGYTFVRGHVRGDGAGSPSPQYSVVDVALETVRRFQRNAI